jgi:hypothetical protein
MDAKSLMPLLTSDFRNPDGSRVGKEWVLAPPAADVSGGGGGNQMPMSIDLSGASSIKANFNNNGDTGQFRQFRGQFRYLCKL